MEEAVKGLLEFCEERPLLGHNLMFDYSFVKHSAVNMGMPFEKQGMDTLKIARVLLPDLESRSLQSLRQYYQIPQQEAHRALEDALTLSVFMKDCGQSLWKSLRNCLNLNPDL